MRGDAHADTRMPKQNAASLHQEGIHDVSALPGLMFSYGLTLMIQSHDVS